MTTVSLLCLAREVTVRGLKETLESLAAQTHQDYEIIFLVGAGKKKDQVAVATAIANYPKAKILLRPNQELLAIAANALLSTLEGEWVAFLAPRDRLLPTALEKVVAGIQANPEAQVIFTDEECRNGLNLVTQRFEKLGLNPFRLRSQEYIRDLAVINVSWLGLLGGFNPITSEWPAHEVYLKTFEVHGAAGFVHIPERLFQRFRVHREKQADVRRQAHMPGFDSEAVRRHLERMQLPAVFRPRAGTTNIRYPLSSSPWVHVFLFLEGTQSECQRRITYAIGRQDYNVSRITAVYTGTDPFVHAGLVQYVRGAMKVEHVPGSIPGYLNQVLQAVDANYVALLRGDKLNSNWLTELLSHALLKNVGVVGGKCQTPMLNTLPGVLGYRYEGWDWNSRGKFNLLNVAHNVSAVSASNMLFSLDRFIEVNGFSEALPTLFGMDFCLRVAGTGRDVLLIPGATVATTAAAPSSDTEMASFRGHWSGWSDPFKQILAW